MASGQLRNTCCVVPIQPPLSRSYQLTSPAKAFRLPAKTGNSLTWASRQPGAVTSNMLKNQHLSLADQDMARRVSLRSRTVLASFMINPHHSTRVAC